MKQRRSTTSLLAMKQIRKDEQKTLEFRRNEFVYLKSVQIKKN